MRLSLNIVGKTPKVIAEALQYLAEQLLRGRGKGGETMIFDDAELDYDFCHSADLYNQEKNHRVMQGIELRKIDLECLCEDCNKPVPDRV